MKIMTRRNFIASAAALAAASPIGSALANDAEPNFLLVQNAKSMSYDKESGKITLKDISPVTIFFADRPDRIVGNMHTSHFVAFWNESGKDSFAKDNPNANLSILEEDKMLTDVVIELSKPSLKGEDLSYNVKILGGEMPAKGGPVSLFIDIIGMPITPVSFAGVARRTAYRRAVYWRR